MAKKISTKGLMPILMTSGGSLGGTKGTRIIATMVKDKVDNDMLEKVIFGAGFLAMGYVAVKSKNTAIKSAAIASSGVFGEFLIDSVISGIYGNDDDSLGEIHDEVREALNGTYDEIEGNNNPVIAGNEPSISFVEDAVMGSEMNEIFGTDWDN